MVYAKQMKDGKVIALLTYSYTPQLSPDSGTEIITGEEYAELMTALKKKMAEKQANNTDE